MTYGELARKSRWQRSKLAVLAGVSFVGVMLSIISFGALIAGFSMSDATMLRWCGIMMVSMCIVAPSAMLLESNSRGAAANKMYASQRRDELIENTNVLLFVLHGELSGDELRVIDFGWKDRHLGSHASREEILIAALRVGASLARVEAMIESARRSHVIVACYLRPGHEPREMCPQMFLIGQHILDALGDRVPVERIRVPDHLELPRQYDFLDMM
ncbi:MAG: hypothetical protein AMXMBFR44_2170 [Candidatus Campbellbacteria bacterium]